MLAMLLLVSSPIKDTWGAKGLLRMSNFCTAAAVVVLIPLLATNGSSWVAITWSYVKRSRFKTVLLL